MTATSTKKVRPLTFSQNLYLGCDPEFFFANADGTIVGSEKIMETGHIGEKNGSKCVIDGVQAELNPLPSTCREGLASQISYCFKNLKAHFDAKKINVAVKVDPLVDITRDELNSLSDKSKVFGCAPSVNIYEGGESKIKVDPKKYLKRSAGGHIHLGNALDGWLKPPYTEEQHKITYASTINVARHLKRTLSEIPEITIPILDIVVGNTCVLLDRFEGNKERRANYGRVGEYRVKPYGLEYRSLSNFWLRSYPLMSFVMGLSRYAIHLVDQSTPDNDYVKALFEAVDRKNIVKAVNENDFDLAYANFKKIEPILLDAAGSGDYPDRYYPIKRSTIHLFHHFIKRINRKGLNYWFPEEPLAHWCVEYRKQGGWEVFATGVIAKDKVKYDAWLAKRKREKAIEAQKAKSPVFA